MTAAHRRGVRAASFGVAVLVAGKALMGVSCAGSEAGVDDGAVEGAGVVGDGAEGDVTGGFICRVPGRACTPLCGDGILKGTEQCDDRNTVGGDGCSSNCMIERSFQCSGGPSVCTQTVCGDGKVRGGEGCDDGNLTPFDGCSEECQVEPLAVDLGGLHSSISGSVTFLNTGRATVVQLFSAGIDLAPAAKLVSLETGSVYEIAVFQAERQTTASSYRLTMTGFNAAPTRCRSMCGDGVVVAAEECDLGKDNSDSAYGGCTASCRWGAFCGDGIVNGPEECDLGKNNGGAYGSGGCTRGCAHSHFCGDGHVDRLDGEECDLGSKNGAALDREETPSTGPTAQVLCTAECGIPAGVGR